MGGSEKQRQDLLDALSTCTATSDTAETLRSLLGSAPPTYKLNGSRRKPANSSRIAETKPKRLETVPKTNSKQSQVVAIHQDAGETISPREKYALATGVVNECLKGLSEAPEPFSNATNGRRTEGSISKRALQPSSGNVTPSRSSVKYEQETPKPNIGEVCTARYVAETAECARTAFEYLVKVDAKKSGLREMPRLQLETGMLALTSKLINHGLLSAAKKQLLQVKERLKIMFPAETRVKNAKTPDISIRRSITNDDLAELLDLDISLASDPQDLSLATIYQLHVLRVIAQSRQPSAIVLSMKYLAIETVNSPAELLMRQAEHPSGKSKSSKQLEGLSRTLLGLCPSVSSSADDSAQNAAYWPSPDVVFDLQTLALRMRMLWWKLADHKADVAKELVEPFMKCASAFTRRSTKFCGPSEIYERLVASLDALGIRENAVKEVCFPSYELLSAQAEKAELHDDSLRWAKEMSRSCSVLQTSHARRVSCVVRETTLRLKSCPKEDRESGFESVSEALRQSLTGNSADYDILLCALSSLSQVVTVLGTSISPTLARNAMYLSASFTMRFAQSYPGKRTMELRDIIITALRLSSSTDDILSWVTESALKVFIHDGTLRTVAEHAGSKPLSLAFRQSSTAMALERIIGALVLKAARSTSDRQRPIVYDHEQLESPERGVLLEAQLKSAMTLAGRVKYEDFLNKAVSDLFQRLAKCYPVERFPVRRARVACMAHRLREAHPSMLPPDRFDVWSACSLDNSALGDDVGLAAFCDDIQASLLAAKAFASGSPIVQDLSPCLQAWQSILTRSKSREDLYKQVDDSAVLTAQLRSIEAYFRVLGEDSACLSAQSLRAKLEQCMSADSETSCEVLAETAKQYLVLGYEEKAHECLLAVNIQLQDRRGSGLARLQYLTAFAEYQLAIDDLSGCRRTLNDASDVREALLPDKVARDERRSFELLHARSWLVHSKYMLEAGSPHEALAAAKRSVRVLNSLWSALERSHGTPIAALSDKDQSEVNVDGLTKGVSKLQLVQTETGTASGAQARNNNGAAFWLIVPDLCMALLHLSNLYAHHGIFNEANYFSERAMSTTQCFSNSKLHQRTRSHRAQLLVLAGRADEAELCLAHDMGGCESDNLLGRIDRLCAQAAIRTSEGELEAARALYEKAEHVLDNVISREYLLQIGSFDKGDTKTHERDNKSLAKVRTSRKAKADHGGRQPSMTVSRRPPETTKRLQAPARPTVPLQAGTDGSREIARRVQSYYLLEKIRLDLQTRKATVALKLGQSDQVDLEGSELSTISSSMTLRTRQGVSMGLIRRALSLLESDVTLNVLPESTISFPATVSKTDRVPEQALIKRKATTVKQSSRVLDSIRPKPCKKNKVPQESFIDLLSMVRDSLLDGYQMSLTSSSTAQSHLECSMLSQSSLLLSAVSDPVTVQALCSKNGSLTIDQSRIKALQFEQRALALDVLPADASNTFTWPVSQGDSCPRPTDPVDFQTEYIDIIPRSWTAVSLFLNEDAEDLFVARYRAGQPPLTIKLPFSRHKPDSPDQEEFDFHKGKAELQEIIKLSNYSCHHSGDANAKGAKTKWWKEREALDRRLHELLINIEDIWFGGFKGIFAPNYHRAELLSAFRRSLDEILDRFLPSRCNAKGSPSKLELDDQVLELFLGLGDHKDGTLDFDEPLADLLYFVVDMLQFQGERNAYDEIDFDEMTISVLGALRTCYEACPSEDEPTQHLILVLDRRLQAFPWESLPCLEDANVSRVGSLLSLRERILALRAAHRQPASENQKDCYTIDRHSGTFILNPSSDLPATQTALEPAVSHLNLMPTSRWSSLIQEPPNEQRFQSALQNSSMVLYFGHGAGSQYIRSRAIRRLESCSEVVWLMGCSSGAVTEHGDLEPAAVPLAYLLAGRARESQAEAEVAAGKGNKKCMAVLATLWDVTDKDIDRFSLAVGEEWSLWPTASGEEKHNKIPAITPRKREKATAVAPSTPQRAPNTMKTPRVLKTPGVAKAPVRDRSRPRRRGGSEKSSLVEAVSRSREACYLRYLNGAAPVVYGVPVYLGD